MVTTGWDISAAEPDIAGTYLAEGPVDLAVVGAGYTGLSTALHAAQLGLSVQVLEADQIGAGGSGRNVGLVNAGSWLPPAQVRRALGATWGDRFLTSFGAAPGQVFDLIERSQIRCAPTRSGTIHAAHAAGGLRDLQRRFADWRALEAPLDLLDRDAMQAMTGSSAFEGGLWDHRAGTVQPLAYCRGLARVAQAEGARVTTHCPVQRLDPDGPGWRVTTDHGVVQARQIVLATNAYTDTLWPGLAGSIMRISYLQLATPPLGDRLQGILPGGQGLWDTGRIMTSLRRDPEGRLIVGSMGRVMGTPHRGASARWAGTQLRRMFPGLGPVRFESAWHGQIAMTHDHIPRLCQLAPGVFTAIGYNGRGITTGTVLGRELAQLVAGADPAGLSLPLTVPQPERLRWLRERAFATAFAANQISGGVLGRLPV